MDSPPILKSPEDLAQMRPACVLTAQALKLAGELAKPGVTTKELDQAAENFIRAHGATPLFLHYPSHHPGVRDFPGTLCISVNNEVVHGIPDARVLKSGDIVSIDVGAKLNGWCGDCARTFTVGDVSKKAAKLLDVTERALMKGIAAIRSDGVMADIGRAIQKEIEGAGYTVVKQFVGHGIGREMHEPPQVPNYVPGVRDRMSGLGGAPKLRLCPGMVLAIEPMANMGKGAVYVDATNGWTVKTRDGSLSAHFEHTVAITAAGAEILTVAP